MSFIMFIFIFFCTKIENIEANLLELEPSNVTLDVSLYDVYDYVRNLDLQVCVFVGIGLKYYAIFVEDQKHTVNGSREVNENYFLGICPLDILKDWKLCSPELMEKRKHKCRLKMTANRYHIRVHRRFCDFNEIVKNKDCQCIPGLFDEGMQKAYGLPTCFIPPLGLGLCKYNVCGLNQCKAATIEGSLYSVQCDCKRPFCQTSNNSKTRTSSVPVITSSWTAWQREKQEVRMEDGEAVAVPSAGNYIGNDVVQRAICLDNSLKTGAFDCLGPGTSCCSSVKENFTNCSCQTFIKNGTLILERHYYRLKSNQNRGTTYKHELEVDVSHARRSRDTRKEYDEDISDDDDDPDNDDTDEEDIALEETNNVDDDEPTSTEVDKEEALENSTFKTSGSEEIEGAAVNITRNISNAKNNSRKVDCINGVIVIMFWLSLVFQ